MPGTPPAEPPSKAGWLCLRAVSLFDQACADLEAEINAENIPPADVLTARDMCRDKSPHADHHVHAGMLDRAVFGQDSDLDTDDD